MEQEIEIIGIDHGWSQIKTASQVFTTAVEEAHSPTFYDNIVEYKGKCYSIGGRRIEVKNTKTENDDYYILSLAAIAKELKGRGKTEARIYLAAGLPLTRFGEEKQSFMDYLGRDKDVRFRFAETDYHVSIEKISVYPQCYAAVADAITEFGAKTVVVDIGSWTIDIMPVVNKRPVDPECNSLPHGLITCMRGINRICLRDYNWEIDEMDMENFMRYRKIGKHIPEKCINLMEKELKGYTEMILRSLKEHEINVETTPVIFVGGGACVMKNFSTVNLPNFEYRLDVKANAKGYETMARYALRERR